jgi:hypothetical protein
MPHNASPCVVPPTLRLVVACKLACRLKALMSVLRLPPPALLAGREQEEGIGEKGTACCGKSHTRLKSLSGKTRRQSA